MAIIAITASGAVDANYSITEVSGTLNVTPAALTITASNAAKVYGAALPAFTAGYSGFVNGDTVASLDKSGDSGNDRHGGQPGWRLSHHSLRGGGRQLHHSAGQRDPDRDNRSVDSDGQ